MDKLFDLRWLAIPLIGLTVGIGYFTQQSDFWPLFIQYGFFFVFFALIFRFSKTQPTLLFFIFVSILLRFILIFTFPNLSDDFYRFVWDGRLLINGYNPFDYLPTHYIHNDFSINGINPTLFDELNSPEYFTIYPPVPQGVFASACWLFPNNILASVMVMKSLVFLFELGSLFFIKKILDHHQLSSRNILLYALNPLIIIELSGNLHFEAAMIFFLLASIYFLTKKENWIFSAIAMGFAIASKLLPLIFLPFLIRRLGWKKSFQYFSVVGITVLALFAPLLSEVFINNFKNSLDLYFQKFEFNASIYYLLRWVGYRVVGYNWIQEAGPALGLVVFIGVIIMVLLEKKLTWKILFEKMLFAICLYLAMTPVVHPWYLSLPILLTIFTRFRFPILWSFLIYLTYVNYSYSEYFESLWIVGIEYILVFSYFIYEFYLKKIRA